MENLAELKNKYVLILLTNTFNQGYENLRKRFGIDKIFHHVITSFENHRIKPDPELFKAAMANIQYNPFEIVVVGDNLHDDIEPAYSLGLNAVLLDRRGRYPDFKKRAITLKGVKEIIDYNIWN
ncbi:hydrolase related to 2-haloalkanoic acid dehalogenase [candidate division TM7 genomosp. GTL1]|nr:hydrolase related to 2-haloalkanoic acid dehalogenase [candidate division TM7 genomosp. GTL1]